MAIHPIETIIVDGVPVDKEALRNELKKMAREFDSVATFRTYDLPDVPNVLIAGFVWKYDAVDLTTADDGVTCIVDAGGRRFKKVPTGGGGGGGGSGIAYQTAIAGTANQLNITASGLSALSATPQWLMFTPALNNTGAAQASLDGGTTNVPIQKANGSAVAADELTAGVPLLGIITLSSLKVLFYGAT